MSADLHKWLLPHRYTVLAFVLSLIGLSLSGCSAPSDSNTTTSGSPALELAAADLVRAVEQDLSASTRITGSLYARQQSTVHPQTSATVQSVWVNNGDQVRQGQVLVSLNDQDQQSRLAQAQANLAQARAQQILSNSIRDRNQKLYQQGFISEIELERSKADARAQQEQVNAQQALLQINQKAIQDSVLRAPLTGIVSQRQVEVGQTVVAGQQLLSIIDPNSLELQAVVNADTQAQIRIGQPIVFYVQGLPEQAFTAQVQRIAPQADPSNRSLTIYASIQTADPKLRAGLFVEGTLQYGEQRRGVVLPKTSIRTADTDNPSDYVWVVEADKILKKPVQIQAIDPVTELALVSGIAVDSQVIRIALAQGANGRQVTIAP